MCRLGDREAADLAPLDVVLEGALVHVVARLEEGDPQGRLLALLEHPRRVSVDAEVVAEHGGVYDPEDHDAPRCGFCADHEAGVMFYDQDRGRHQRGSVSCMWRRWP